METLNDYRDHGDPKNRLDQDVDKAEWIFEQLPLLGINIDKITNQLEIEGVEKFEKSFDQLIETLKGKLS
jgi:transaldolase